MTLDSPDATRAPGRGRYERRHSSAQRFLAQRARLLRATAIAHLEGEVSVTRVTALSGVGRNTFYECFDDFGHALQAMRWEELRRVQRGLAALGVVAGADGVARLCGVWLALIAEGSVNALAALEPPRGQPSSELLAPFRSALLRVLPHVGARPARLTHATACAESSARVVALAVMNSPGSSQGGLLGEGAAGSLSRAGLVLAHSIHRLVG